MNGINLHLIKDVFSVDLAENIFKHPKMRTTESARLRNAMYLAVLLDIFVRLITKNEIVFDMKPKTIKIGKMNASNA
jgi:hypothetical protein